MKAFKYLPILLMFIVSSCNVCKTGDLFRKKEYRCLEKCERRFVKAINECPQLIDTVKLDTIIHDTITVDTTVIDTILMDVVDDVFAEDALEISFGIDKDDRDAKIEELKRKIASRYSKRIVKEVVYESVLKKPMYFNKEGIEIKVWQDGGVIRLEVIGNKTKVNIPKKEHPWKYYLKWLIIFIIGFVILIGVKKGYELYINRLK